MKREDSKREAGKKPLVRKKKSEGRRGGDFEWQVWLSASLLSPPESLISQHRAVAFKEEHDSRAELKHTHSQLLFIH